MSYRIVVKSNAGTNTVTVEGEVPDGEHWISGEDDGDVVATTVERRDELGRYVNRAMAHYSRREVLHGLAKPRA